MSSTFGKTSKELSRERPQVPKTMPKLDTKSLEMALNAKSDDKADLNERSIDSGGLGLTAGLSSEFDTDRNSPSGLSSDGRMSPRLKNGRLVSTPSLTSPRLDRRFWPKDTRGLLEICEQGYQLQQGMKSHCADATSTLEQLVVDCESTVNGMLVKLEDAITVIQKEAEKPANVDWSPIYREFSGKISPAIIQSVLESTEATVARFEKEILGQISKIGAQMHGSIGSFDEAQRAELLVLRQEIREVQKGTAAFEETTLRSQEQMLNALRDQQQILNNLITSRFKEVLDGVEDNNKHLVGIEPLLENHLTKQLQDSKAHDEQHIGFIKEIHRVVHADFGHLFHEIGTIQRAMNLPFVHKHVKAAAPRDGHQCREYWTQTDAKDTSEVSSQTDLNITMPPPEKKKKDVAKKAVARTVNTRAVAVVKAKEQLASTNPLLADEQTKRKKLRERLLKRQYNVADFYFETGCAQRIARSTLFENMTFFIIFMNALWIAVDTDNNDANLIYDADTAYQAVENSFCTYFSIELLIRFLAFRKKRNCMKDFWFVFDGFLVVGMIVETWVVTGLYLFLGVQFGQSGGVGDLSVLRLMRVVKIFRMARMARLLRSVPELVMIMKGMGIAFRSVIFFVLLAVVVLYVFAVAFRQITKDTVTGDKYFPTVPKAMGYLLLDGMLPIYAPIVNNVSEGNMYLWPIIMIFILLSSVTILNMLVGVLTEVVRNVAASEKDAMTVTHVTQQLRIVLGEFQKSYEIDETKSDAGEPTTRKKSLKRMMTANIVPLGVGLAGDKVDESLIKLSKKDFEAFLTKPDVMKIIQDVGVDVVGLLDNAEVIYEDKDKEGTGLSFVDFIDVVLNLRGTNPATVKDIKETQRILKTDVQNARDKVRQYITKELSSMRSEMVAHFFHLEHKDSDSEDEVATHSAFPRDRSRPVHAFNVSENPNDSERAHERKVSFSSLDDDEVVPLPRDLMS